MVRYTHQCFINWGGKTETNAWQKMESDLTRKWCFGVKLELIDSEISRNINSFACPQKKRIQFYRKKVRSRESWLPFEGKHQKSDSVAFHSISWQPLNWCWYQHERQRHQMAPLFTQICFATSYTPHSQCQGLLVSVDRRQLANATYFSLDWQNVRINNQHAWKLWFLSGKYIEFNSHVGNIKS